MIDTVNWKVNANRNVNSYNPKNAYNNEISVASNYSAKIGLMYVSDYGYAASPIHWGKTMYNNSMTDYRAASANNWMYMGLNEWTITAGGSSGYIHYVASYGNVSTSYANNSFAIRPTFYLNANVAYQEGDGSIDSPFRIYLPS